jgi:DNA-binding MarR family transcriptional regulator
MSIQNSKADEIRDEIRETPCIGASEISEEYGVSPATVARVVKNLDEELKRMRQLRMKKHVDDLGDVERDLLWIVAQHPEATQQEILEAYPSSKSSSTIRESDSPGEVWRNCLDSDWRSQTALAGDLQDLLDEGRVSAAAQEAVDTLKATEISEEATKRSEAQGLSDLQVDLLRETVKEPAAANSELERRAGYEVDGHGNGGSGFTKLYKRDERLKARDGSRAEAAADLLEKYGYEVPETDDEDADDDHECEYCGDPFEHAGALGKHEKHCDARPEQKLTNTNIKTLRRIVDEGIEDLSALASTLDISYDAVTSRMQSIRQRGREIKAETLLDDARRILDEVDEQVEDDVDEDDQDERESDDVEMQETPTDRDIEQGREAAEDVLDGEGDETPHVKNESETNVDAPLLVDEDNVIGIGRVEHGDDSAEVRVEVEKLKQALDLAGQDKVVLRVADDYPLLITGERGSNLGVGVAPRIDDEEEGGEA